MAIADWDDPAARAKIRQDALDVAKLAGYEDHTALVAELADLLRCTKCRFTEPTLRAAWIVRKQQALRKAEAITHEARQ